MEQITRVKMSPLSEGRIAIDYPFAVPKIYDGFSSKLGRRRQSSLRLPTTLNMLVVLRKSK